MHVTCEKELPVVAKHKNLGLILVFSVISIRLPEGAYTTFSKCVCPSPVIVL